MAVPNLSFLVRAAIPESRISGSVLFDSPFQKAPKPAFTPDMVQGKDPKAAATTLLDNAMTLAVNGSWERIAVGRAWYLGGDKAKGQQIFDAVTSGSKKYESSDWARIARVYVEANEWDKAAPIFGMVCSTHKDVAKAKIKQYREARRAKKVGQGGKARKTRKVGRRAGKRKG